MIRGLVPLLADLLARPATATDIAPSEWQSVLTVAVAEQLGGTLAFRLADQPVPAAVRAALDNARSDARHLQRAARWEADRIAAALDVLDEPVLLLKGAAFLVAGYAAAEGRAIGDVDILVPRHALADAERLLLAAGWQWAKTDAYDDLYYRRWMHELPPMIHSTRDRMVDVHHTILPPTARPTPDPAAILRRARPSPLPGLSIPCPTDLLVHAAAHLLADGELAGGLRNLWDIDRLVAEHGSAGFWSDLGTHAAQHELEEAVCRALRLSQRLFGTRVPDGIAGPQKWSDHLFVRRLTARDGWGRERRPVTRLGFAIRGHLLRMPPRLLLPHLARKARRVWVSRD